VSESADAVVIGGGIIGASTAHFLTKLGYDIANAQEGIEALSWKVGTVLVVLGTMHFFNLFVFTHLRRRTHGRHNNHPPVNPDSFTQVGQEV